MTTSSKIRTYQLAYWIEAGFRINIEAKTKRQAIRTLEKMLADKMDILPNSERVHYDDGLTGDCTLVKG